MTRANTVKLRRTFCSALAICTLLTNGCAHRTTYQAPILPAPAQWQEKTSSAEKANDVDLQNWWKCFGDAQLDTLIDEALHSNLDLQQAQMRITQARAALQGAGAAEYPTVNAIGTVARSDTSNNITNTNKNLISTGPSTVYKAGFDATWELDWLGRTQQHIEAAQARYDASVEDARATQLTLLGDIASNYVALRNSQQQRDITLRNIAAQRNTLELTQQRYQHGLTGFIDVAQAQTQLTSTEAVLPTLEAANKQYMRQLAILLGREPSALTQQLSTAATLPTVDTVNATTLPSDLLTRRPDLRREERKLAAAANDVGIAKAARYPTFDLTMGLGLQSNNASHLSDLSSRYWSVIPGLQLPLFDGGKIRTNIDDKQAKYEEAELHYQDAFNKALLDVENALSGFYAETARYNTLLASEKSAAIAVDIAEERYTKGIDSFLNVLAAQKNLYNAQSSRAQAQANSSTQAIALYKALGGGWK